MKDPVRLYPKTEGRPLNVNYSRAVAVILLGSLVFAVIFAMLGFATKHYGVFL